VRSASGAHNLLKQRLLPLASVVATLHTLLLELGLTVLRDGVSKRILIGLGRSVALYILHSPLAVFVPKSNLGPVRIYILIYRSPLLYIWGYLL
jgi:hypothetical protein